MASKLTAKQRRTNLILLVCAILLVAMKLLLDFLPAAAPAGDATEEDSVQLSPEELERRSKEDVITMTILHDLTFETGDGLGNLQIRNEETNSHPIVVEITRSDTGKSIYSSGVIPIGAGVDEDSLAVALPAGEYDCVATFSYVDEDTGKVLGSSELGITVHVLS